MKELSDNERAEVRHELLELAHALEEERIDCQPHMVHSKTFLRARVDRVRRLAALFEPGGSEMTRNGGS
jgi:hypothetical protein